MSTEAKPTRCTQCKSWVPEGVEVCETCIKENAGNIGSIAIERISSLFSCQCAENENHGCVIVWSGGALEQIEAMILDLSQKAIQSAKQEAA